RTCRASCSRARNSALGPQSLLSAAPAETPDTQLRSTSRYLAADNDRFDVVTAELESQHAVVRHVENEHVREFTRCKSSNLISHSNSVRGVHRHGIQHFFRRHTIPRRGEADARI